MLIKEQLTLSDNLKLQTATVEYSSDTDSRVSHISNRSVGKVKEPQIAFNNKVAPSQPEDSSRYADTTDRNLISRRSDRLNVPQEAELRVPTPATAPVRLSILYNECGPFTYDPLQIKIRNQVNLPIRANIWPVTTDLGRSITDFLRSLE